MKETEAHPLSKWRFWLVCACLAMLALALSLRLLYLQAVDGDRGAEFLRKQGNMRAVRTAEIPVYRGVITDRVGTPLAVSSPVISLWANPGQLKTTSRLDELVSLLDLDKSQLLAKLESYEGKQFMYLARHQPPEVARLVLQANISGVHAQREYRRFYPVGELTSQVVGLTNLDGKGIAGIELAFDEWLSGVQGKKRFIKDLHGEAVRDFGAIIQPRPGRDISLSLDLRLQYVQHRELKKAIARTRATSVSAITLDSWTGEILAVSNYPTFNPNNRGRMNYANVRNRALTDLFEPGSTIKTFTIVAALESKKFNVDTIVDTSPGHILVGNKFLHDPRDYGKLSVSQVFERSSQVGVTKIAKVIGHNHILNVFNRFGLGEPTGTGFPGERTGVLPDIGSKGQIDRVTLAFGYGISATPIQLARAYSVFANEGQLLPLSLIKQETEERIDGDQIISKAIASDIIKLLARAATSEGTGALAQVPSFSVGGKTGTVHKVGANGYLKDQYLAWFVGIAPISAPRYVTAVLIDRPQGDQYAGGLAAAPVYSNITREVLRIRNVRPEKANLNSLLAVSMSGDL